MSWALRVPGPQLPAGSRGRPWHPKLKPVPSHWRCPSGASCRGAVLCVQEWRGRIQSSLLEPAKAILRTEAQDASTPGPLQPLPGVPHHHPLPDGPHSPSLGAPWGTWPEAGDLLLVMRDPRQGPKGTWLDKGPCLSLNRRPRHPLGVLQGWGPGGVTPCLHHHYHCQVGPLRPPGRP